MPLTFDRLVNLYRHIAFDPVGDEGTLFVATQELLSDIEAIENDDAFARAANISVLTDDPLSVGQRVRVRVSAPRVGIGILVRTFDDLLKSPARLAEPQAYFIIEGQIERNTSPTPDLIVKYRRIVQLIEVLTRAAAYLDQTRLELVFFRQPKLVVPVRYDAANVSSFSVEAADEFLGLFADELHAEQKLTLLIEAIAHVTEAQPSTHRFAFLLQNLAEVSEEVRHGYRLFTSSFSYAKIKSDIENAKAEYISKVHKTLTDIQGQLLGIPVATIVVASQMRPATDCGLEFWTNVAVLCGAWIFFTLLCVAILNQWFTLSSIENEVTRQKDKLDRDFVAISEQFRPSFAAVSSRICWHRAALLGIGFIALIGALFATGVYHRLTSSSISACVFNGTPQAASQSAGSSSTVKEETPPLPEIPPAPATPAKLPETEESGTAPSH